MRYILIGISCFSLALFITRYFCIQKESVYDTYLSSRHFDRTKTIGILDSLIGFSPPNVGIYLKSARLETAFGK